MAQEWLETMVSKIEIQKIYQNYIHICQIERCFFEGYKALVHTCSLRLQEKGETAEATIFGIIYEKGSLLLKKGLET